jgi:hypothetical protein
MIKGSVTAQNWDVRSIEGIVPDDKDEQLQRIKIAKSLFNHPNNQDSFQSFMEMMIEDLCVVGSTAVEMRFTINPDRPMKLWTVNTESIRIFTAWSESTPDMPHYAQMTGLKGERGAIIFYDDELLYLKDNQATDSPFGLGKMEVAFASVGAVLGVQDMAGRAGADQIHKCFPEWTEVLTRRGWVFWRDVREDDEFATRSIYGQLQWQKALGFVNEQHDGDLIQFSKQRRRRKRRSSRENRDLKISVTPHHRMYGWKCSKDWRTGKTIEEPLGFIQAHELEDGFVNRPGKGWRGKSTTSSSLSDFRIPTRSVWKDGVLPSADIKIGKYTFTWKDWAAFLGIWIAEGSCMQSIQTSSGVRKPSKGEYRIQIAQSVAANSPKYAKIADLLDRMGIECQKKADRFIFSDSAIWNYLVDLGLSHDKFVPQWVKDAPVEIIESYVDFAMLGDGTCRPGTTKRVYYTVSKQLAGDMQELFQKIGSSAAIGEKIRRNGTRIYTVEEMVREDISIAGAGSRSKARMPKRIPYSGRVYCAMVPNGTLYCREGGYAFWSGNTWLWWEQPQPDSAYQIVRRHIQNELEGQAKVSIIGGMKKPEVVEITPVSVEDLLLPWQEMLIRMIANAFDLSAMSLGITEDVNRATGAVLSDRDFRTAVVPMARRIEDAFTRRILHAKLGWYDLEFKFLNLDDPDAQTKMGLFAQQYSANAITPNQIAIGMGRQPQAGPFGNLTQFEAMIVMQMITAQIQDQSADKNNKRQQDMMLWQQKQMAPPDDPNGGGSGGQDGEEDYGEPTPSVQPPTVQQLPAAPPSSDGQAGPKLPKMALPKFPVAGSAYTAMDLARMPVNDLASLVNSGALGDPKKLLPQMQNQDPNILEQMSQEVKEFFDSVQKAKEKEEASKVMSPQQQKALDKEQKKRRKKQGDRTHDYTDFLYKKGADLGNPGGPRMDRAGNKSGTPGTINYWSRP